MLGRLIPDFLKRYLRKYIREEVISLSETVSVARDHRNPDGTQVQVRTGNTVQLFRPENLILGKLVWIGHFTIIDSTSRVIIGDGCQVGSWVCIFSHTTSLSLRLYGYHWLETDEKEKTGFVKAPVSIGKFTFIGAHSIISPGASIGSGCIVKPFTLIPAHMSVPDFSIVEGNPARITGDTREGDKLFTGRDPALLEWYNEWSK